MNSARFEVLMTDGRGFMQERNYDVAADYFEKAAKLNPASEEAWDEQGHALIAGGYHGDAVTAFSKGLKADPQILECGSARGGASSKLSKTMMLSKVLIKHCEFLRMNLLLYIIRRFVVRPSMMMKQL